tara:strand:- start:946 stop:1167 length:222 start_codon:yes stop_codon:yes gene_type:complete
MINKDTSSLDIVCASDFEEFYYKHNDEPVPEGEPVGLDIAIKRHNPWEEESYEIELVLFSDVYWNPQYPMIDE